MAGVTVDTLAESIAEALADKLGARGDTLERQVRRAGRKLPRGVRRDVLAVAGAQRLRGNPRLERQIDLGRLEAAERRVLAYLNTVNMAERRVTGFVNALAALVLSLIVVAGLAIGVMVWQGLL